MGQTGTKKDEDETTPPQAEEDETTATHEEDAVDAKHEIREKRKKVVRKNIKNVILGVEKKLRNIGDAANIKFIFFSNI